LVEFGKARAVLFQPFALLVAASASLEGLTCVGHGTASAAVLMHRA
jgi:hypothetical protein